MPHARAAGVENKVPGLAEQRRGRLLRRGPRRLGRVEHHAAMALRKTFLHQLPEDAPRGRGLTRRLEHHAIPGRHGADERDERELEGIVPRREHEGEPDGLGRHLAEGGQDRAPRPDAPRPGKGGGTGGIILRGVEGFHDFRDIGLAGRLGEVVMERRHDGALPPPDGGSEAAQLRLPEGRVQRGARGEEAPHLRLHGGKVLLFHALAPSFSPILCRGLSASGPPGERNKKGLHRCNP